MRTLIRDYVRDWPETFRIWRINHHAVVSSNSLSRFRLLMLMAIYSPLSQVSGRFGEQFAPQSLAAPLATTVGSATYGLAGSLALPINSPTARSSW